MGAMLVVASILASGLSDEPLAAFFENVWPVVPLVAFWHWGAPAVIQVVTRWQFRREGIREGRTLEAVSLGQDGVTPGLKWSHPIPWSEVRRVQETKNLIVIDATSDSPTYLPKDALTREDRARLEELLREQFRDRPKDLQLGSESAKVARGV
jgi:hypothetical protein